MAPEEGDGFVLADDLIVAGEKRIRFRNIEKVERTPKRIHALEVNGQPIEGVWNLEKAGHRDLITALEGCLKREAKLAKESLSRETWTQHVTEDFDDLRNMSHADFAGEIHVGSSLGETLAQTAVDTLCPGTDPGTLLAIFEAKASSVSNPSNWKGILVAERLFAWRDGKGAAGRFAYEEIRSVELAKKGTTVAINGHEIRCFSGVFGFGRKRELAATLHRLLNRVLLPGQGPAGGQPANQPRAGG
jgi:hypothetical protein